MEKLPYIFAAILIIFFIIGFIFKSKVNNTLLPPYENKLEMEADMQKAISLSKQIQDPDSNLNELEKLQIQEEVNTNLNKVRDSAIAYDGLAKEQAKKIKPMTTVPDKLNVFLNKILKQWEEHNLTLSSIAREQLDAHWKDNAPYAMPIQLLEEINKAISKTKPDNQVPAWFKEFDTFFVEHSDYKDLDKHYMTLITLSLPFVSIEEVVKLSSMTDGKLYSNEMPFISTNVPRDTNEAKRLYAAILELPKKTILHNPILGKHTSSQAFRAQMWMVQFVQNHFDNVKLFHYQKEVIISAPDYLFDYPDYNVRDIASSARPAFWMAYDNPSVELNKIIESKSTSVFKKHFEEKLQHLKRQDNIKQIISTSAPKDGRKITERASNKDYELVTLLVKFETILKEHNITLPKPLNDEQIQKLQNYLSPFKLPDEYITLYKWHNGIPEFLGYDLSFFLPIESNLYEYNFLNEGEYYNDFWWGKHLFPLKSFNGDTFWYIDMNKSNISKVQYFFVEGGDPEVLYISIQNMVKKYIRAFEEGIITFDRQRGIWEMDNQAFEKITF